MREGLTAAVLAFALAASLPVWVAVCPPPDRPSVPPPDVRTVTGIIVTDGNVNIGLPMVVRDNCGVTYTLVFVARPEMRGQILRMHATMAHVVGLYAETVSETGGRRVVTRTLNVLYAVEIPVEIMVME